MYFKEVPYLYVINPFLAAVGAGLPTSAISRYGHAYETIQHNRKIIAIGKGKKLLNPKKKEVFLKAVKSGGLRNMSDSARKMHLSSFIRNWLMLSLYTAFLN
jgi:hypothetical protein